MARVLVEVDVDGPLFIEQTIGSGGISGIEIGTSPQMLEELKASEITILKEVLKTMGISEGVNLCGRTEGIEGCAAAGIDG